MSYWTRTQLKDQYGFIVEATPFGELRVVSPFRLVGAIFSGGTVDTKFWTVSTASGATITQSSGQLIATSGGTANGSAQIYSVRKARYTGGSSNRFRGQIQFSDTGVANNIRKWGLSDGSNGAYFMLSGTALSVVTFLAGSETTVAQASWSSSTVGPTLTNITSYEIYFSNSKVYFVISDVLMHTVSAATAPWTASLNLPIYMSNINSGGATTTSDLRARVATVYRLGEGETQPLVHVQTATTAGTQLKYGAGNIHGMVYANVTQNAQIILADGTAAGATIFDSGALGAKTDANSLEFHNIPFNNGLWMSLTGAAANVIVAYE